MKALIIRGPVEDLDDVLHIAREEATKIFKVNPKRVKVKPFVHPFGLNDYLVVVEVDGCRRTSEVVRGRKVETSET